MARDKGQGAKDRHRSTCPLLPTTCSLLLLTLLWGRMARAAPLWQVPIVAPDAVSTPVSVQNPNHNETPLPIYVVKAGDTLWSVALEIGLDLASMPCAVAPDFAPDQPLVIGDPVELLPSDQWCHTVAPGETLATIGARYGATPAQIYAVPWNQLQATPLPAVQVTPGRHLRVPLKSLLARSTGAHDGGEGMPVDDSSSFLTWMLQQPVDTSPFAVLAVGGPFAEHIQQTRQLTDRAVRVVDQAGAATGPLPANWPYGSGVFTWPLAGWLTQGYRYDHRALDIAAPSGTLVTAADRGVVRRAGWNNQGYGLFVIIDHNIDYVTLYAHLSDVLVEEGQVVAQGELIGKVGSTGNSTGPHLHFEIRDFGRLTNPLELLTHGSQMADDGR